MTVPADSDLPRLLAGRFRLEAVLGHGRMGLVYRAHDETMQRLVAVKLVETDPGVEDHAVMRFLREARNTARITHPHIVHLYDLGRGDDGELFFVMELLAGETLAQRLERLGALDVDEALHIAKQVCVALAYAHRRGLVHRDLKPANVMLLERGADSSYVKVLDFGVAKAAEEGTQLTKTGMMVGTVDCMAPEQILSSAVDQRTDVYALGVMLYRMISGTRLFADAPPPVLVRHHLSTKPEPLRQRARRAPLSPEIEAVVMRCLEKRAEHRFGSMEELQHALEAAAPAKRSLWVAPAGEFDDLQDMATVRHEAAESWDAVTVAQDLRAAEPQAATLPVAQRVMAPIGAPGQNVPPPRAQTTPLRERPVSLPPPRAQTTPLQERRSPSLLPAGAPSAAPAAPAAPGFAAPVPAPAGAMAPRAAAVVPAPARRGAGRGVLRWIGLLAPLPAGVYCALVGPTPLALAALGGGLILGGMLFLLGLRR